VSRSHRQDWEPPAEWTSRELVLARGLDGRIPRYQRWRQWPLAAAAPAEADPARPPYDGSVQPVR
jgi:hypothetical protein